MSGRFERTPVLAPLEAALVTDALARLAVAGGPAQSVFVASKRREGQPLVERAGVGDPVIDAVRLELPGSAPAGALGEARDEEALGAQLVRAILELAQPRSPFRAGRPNRCEG